MKYEMPVLTDEQRDRAIAECLQEIQSLQDSLAKTDAYRLVTESRLHRQQIALASLTAEPDVYVCQKTYSAPELETRVYRVEAKKDLKKGYTLYTSAPVPALKPIMMPQLIHVREVGFIGYVYDAEEIEEAIKRSGYEVKE